MSRKIRKISGIGTINYAAMELEKLGIEVDEVIYSGNHLRAKMYKEKLAVAEWNGLKGILLIYTYREA